MHDWILQPFLPIFHTLPALDQSRTYTLEDCLFAGAYRYMVRVVEDSLVLFYLGDDNSTRGKKMHLIGARLPSSRHVDYSMFPV